MIPEVAHFHWSGPPMSWLRMVSLASFRRHNPGWEIRLHDSIPESRHLALPQQADWTWWEKLWEHGGFQVATDIVFLRPVPREWLDSDIVACTRGTQRIYQFAMLGAKPRHPYMENVVQHCRKITGCPPDLQQYGVWALNACGLPEGVRELPMDALCPYDDLVCEAYWGEEPVELGPEVVGVHWYGGHTVSRREERSARPDGKRFIERLAAEQLA